jgi:hypothetical protein
MAITTFLADEVLDHILGVGAYAAPTCYLALSTSDPASSVTEPVAMGYLRVAVAGKFSAAASNTSANTSIISFPQASGNWGTIGWVCLYDSGPGAGGNLLWYGQLGTSKAVGSGDTLSFSITPSGQLSFSIN